MSPTQTMSGESSPSLTSLNQPHQSVWQRTRTLAVSPFLVLHKFTMALLMPARLLLHSFKESVSDVACALIAVMRFLLLTPRGLIPSCLLFVVFSAVTELDPRFLFMRISEHFVSTLQWFIQLVIDSYQTHTFLGLASKLISPEQLEAAVLSLKVLMFAIQMENLKLQFMKAAFDYQYMVYSAFLSAFCLRVLYRAYLQWRLIKSVLTLDEKECSRIIVTNSTITLKVGEFYGVPQFRTFHVDSTGRHLIDVSPAVAASIVAQKALGSREMAVPENPPVAVSTLPKGVVYFLDDSQGVIGHAFRIDDYLYTARHVVEHAPDMVLIVSGHIALPLKLREEDVEFINGLDVVRFKPKQNLFAALQIKSAKLSVSHCETMLISYAIAFNTFVRSAGTCPLTEADISDDWQAEYHHACSTRPGASGTALMNNNGDVLGIHVGSDKPNVKNLYVPSAYIILLFKQHRIRESPWPKQQWDMDSYPSDDEDVYGDIAGGDYDIMIYDNPDGSATVVGRQRGAGGRANQRRLKIVRFKSQGNQNYKKLVASAALRKTGKTAKLRALRESTLPDSPLELQVPPVEAPLPSVVLKVLSPSSQGPPKKLSTESKTQASVSSELRSPPALLTPVLATPTPPAEKSAQLDVPRPTEVQAKKKRSRRRSSRKPKSASQDSSSMSSPVAAQQ
jgi:hypothetical protein